jgi:hypothetical protein
MPGNAPAGDSRSERCILDIAGLAIELDQPLCPVFSAWPEVYHSFLRRGSDPQVDARFLQGADALRPTESRFTVTYAAGAWQAGRVANREVFRFSAGDLPAYLWAEPNADYSRVEVWPDPVHGRPMPPLLHPVDRVLCMGVLVHRRRLMVHACGWLHNGRTLLFPGVSGAGKTTICNQIMAAGQGAILSDDRVVLRESADGLAACGTPWPGDAKQARNESAPLRAICFIEKAAENRLTPITPMEALRRIFETASVPWFKPDMRDTALLVVERLIQTTPAYRLDWRPDPGVVDCLLPLLQ